jgi:hypothetical protein
MKQMKKVKEFREVLANGLLNLPAFAGPGGQKLGDEEKDSKFRKVRFSSFPDATHSLTCNYSSQLSTTSRTTLTTVTKGQFKSTNPEDDQGLQEIRQIPRCAHEQTSFCDDA